MGTIAEILPRRCKQTFQLAGAVKGDVPLYRYGVKKHSLLTKQLEDKKTHARWSLDQQVVDFPRRRGGQVRYARWLLDQQVVDSPCHINLVARWLVILQENDAQYESALSSDT